MIAPDLRGGFRSFNIENEKKRPEGKQIGAAAVVAATAAADVVKARVSLQKRSAPRAYCICRSKRTPI